MKDFFDDVLRAITASEEIGANSTALRLPGRFAMAHPDQAVQTPQPPKDGHPGVDPAEDWPTLDVLRLRYIHRAIEHTNNNKTRAAELLGIDRRTLNRILARERARRRATAGEATH